MILVSDKCAKSHFQVSREVFSECGQRFLNCRVNRLVTTVVSLDPLSK